MHLVLKTDYSMKEEYIAVQSIRTGSKYQWHLLDCLQHVQLVFKAFNSTAVQHQTLTSCGLVVQGMGWEAQCGEDLQHLLHTLQHLPMDPSQAANVAPLVNLCNTRFAALPSQLSSSTHSATAGERARHLHQSLTENDARAQKLGGELQPLSAIARQHEEPAPDRETASSSRPQDSAELGVHASGETEADSMMQHRPHAAARLIHDASQQSADAVDDVPALSTPQDAPQNDSVPSSTEGTDRSANSTGDSEGHPSTWNGTRPADSYKGQASQEAQGAAVVLEEVADQDVGTADDGEVDMVATSRAMLANPVPLVKLPSQLSTPSTEPEFDSGVVSSSNMQPDVTKSR